MKNVITHPNSQISPSLSLEPKKSKLLPRLVLALAGLGVFGYAANDFTNPEHLWEAHDNAHASAVVEDPGQHAPAFELKPRIWYDRMDALEAMAVEGEDLDFATKTRLWRVAHFDDHPINRRLAVEMLESQDSVGDYTQTEPHRDNLAAELRGTISVDPSMGYDANAIWYYRKDAVEALARTGDCTDQNIKDLLKIAVYEDDWRIEKLANEMVESCQTHGDFSQSEPYQRMVAADKRANITLISDIPYDPSAIWYTRLDALEALDARSIDDKVLVDLQTIADNEDDWRIRELANTLLGRD